jgi:hypothetical protein
MAATFRRSAAAGAFGDVENDTEGSSFKLIPENALALGWKKIHDPGVKLERKLIDIEMLM